jgi:hypothetical protein
LAFSFSVRGYYTLVMIWQASMQHKWQWQTAAPGRQKKGPA